MSEERSTLEFQLALKMAHEYVLRTRDAYSKKDKKKIERYVSVVQCLHLPTGLKLKEWWEEYKF